jgi:hypothetical protein
MSNSSCNNSAGDIGRGSELKYEFYFPPNSCMPKDEGMGKCPVYPYPLQNIPSCPSIYVPCSNPGPVVKSIYGASDPMPSELYGDALGMNEGNGLFYYNDPYGFNLTALTFEHKQPYHFARTSF